MAEWIPGLARRLEQLDRIASLDNLSNVEVWLGGLFFPEAYITATRQAVAHRKRWSLETLDLRLDIESVNDPNAFIIDGKSSEQNAIASYSFFTSGLVLEGAAWSSDKLMLNNGDSIRLNPSQLRWVQLDETDRDAQTFVTLPVYLNSDRSDVLFTVKLPSEIADRRLVAMRAVCLVADA